MAFESYKKRFEKEGYTYLGAYYNQKLLLEWPSRFLDGTELLFKKNDVIVQVVYREGKLELANVISENGVDRKLKERLERLLK